VLSALHTIASYPPDLSDPIFEHYPAMKFGDRRSVAHFAEALAPVAARHILQCESEGRDWVLTSPPLSGLRCGANLLCRAVHAVLEEGLPGDIRVRLEESELAGERTPIDNQTEFEHYNEYSKLDLATRREILCGVEKETVANAEAFRGRSVLFVNDINVTGTQLRWTNEVLRRSLPARLDWLFIVNVDMRVGRRFPHLESEINNSKFARAEEFLAFLRDRDFDCTGKLVARLMSYDAQSLERIFLSLSVARRAMLHRAILDEGIYAGPLFREKIDTVERTVRQA
jgi:hypothetical protein